MKRNALILTALVVTGAAAAWLTLRSPASATAASAKAPHQSREDMRAWMVDHFILDEAQQHGTSGDSLKQTFDEPMTLAMRLYQVKDGKPQLIQSRTPDANDEGAAAFHFGYLFRPGPDDESRSLEFLYADLDHPAKEYGHALILDGNRRATMTGKFNHGMSAMRDLVPGTEQVMAWFTAADPSRIDCRNQSVDQVAADLRGGYILTATATPAD